MDPALDVGLTLFTYVVSGVRSEAACVFQWDLTDGESDFRAGTHRVNGLRWRNVSLYYIL